MIEALQFEFMQNALLAGLLASLICGVMGTMVVVNRIVFLSGGIAHAQLTFDNAMIMLGTARDDEFGKLQPAPAILGGTTQSPYIVVPDADAAFERAKSAGAEIVVEIADQDYGGRVFSCRDPEGHLWNFGSYDPWA